MTQQDNCTCRVTIENQIETISIGLRKYGGLSSSAPDTYGCGLANIVFFRIVFQMMMIDYII
jgi:hypothetical protein